MTIRLATAADIPLIVNLERTSPTAAHWSQLQYERLLASSDDRPNRLVLVASSDASDPPSEEAEKTLLGFLVARFSAEEWELENIVVSPAGRRKGLGLQLLQRLLTRATETNAASVFLEVRESNAAARSLYQKAGFRETGRRKSYYTDLQEDAILYSWSPG